MDWQVAIADMLRAAGTHGCKQSDLIAKAKRHADDGQVKAFLMTLAQERRVQKYILPGDVTVWRATTNLDKLQ